MQLEEMVANVQEEATLIIKDYCNTKERLLHNSKN